MIDLPCEIGSAWNTHGRPVAVALQGVEERRAVPGRDAVQDGQVQLQRPFPGVEDPPEMMAGPAGQVLDRDLGHQVQVKFRPDPGQRPGQFLGTVIRRAVHQVSWPHADGEPRERGRVVAGPVGEPAADHARLEIEVEPRGHDRVVETGDHHDLVAERIVRAAPAAHLLAQRLLLLLGHVLDDQDLEVRPVGAGLLRRTGVGVLLGAQVQGLVVAVGIRWPAPG